LVNPARLLASSPSRRASFQQVLLDALRPAVAHPAAVESTVGTAETEMDEGKPTAVTARDSETDSEQQAEPDGVDKM
jgi:hypothetical protein